MTSIASPPAPAVRGADTLKSFTGLLPLILFVPLVLLQLWALGSVVWLAGCVLVIAIERRTHQTITALDWVMLAFAGINAIAYFGFRNTFVLFLVAPLIYVVLCAQVIDGEVRGEPWTLPFAKRSYPAMFWQTRGFIEGNRFVSRLWGVAFFLSALLAGFGHTRLFQFVLPLILMCGCAVLTPRAARWYGRKFASPRAHPGA